MIYKNCRGQTLVESLAALWVLLIIFFSIYYIFLIGLDKIRSLDTVFHLARVQQVQKTNGLFLAKSPLVMLQCFGRPGIPRLRDAGGSNLRVSEVSFQFLHNFSSSLILPHKSTMRVAQPDTDYLNRSYPGAAEDSGGAGTVPQLGKEEAMLVAIAHGSNDAVVDAAEDLQAIAEADKP